MKKDDVENILDRLQVPEPENKWEHRELKIPILSYRKSSIAGFWLLLIPLIVAFTIVLKLELGLQTGYVKLIQKFFAALDENVVLTYLIPLVFIGLPLLSMIINFLAICHFQQDKKAKELLVTIKYRPFNIVLFLVSLALLVFFLLPDKLSF